MTDGSTRTRPHAKHPAQRRWLGARIRDRRRRIGLTQAGLAEAIGISPSYLNLIEANKRPVSATLLQPLAAALGVTQAELSDSQDSRIFADLQEMNVDPVLAGAGLGNPELRALITAVPGAAVALLRLYRAYRAERDQVRTLRERVSQDPVLANASHDILTRITAVRSFAEILRDYRHLDESRRDRFHDRLVSETERLARVATDMFGLLEASGGGPAITDPTEEVDDLLHDAANHFPDLERAAELLRPAMDVSGGLYLTDLIRYLESRHNVRVVRVAAQMLPHGHEWDAAARVLRLSLSLPLASARFQAARLTARLDASEAVEATLQHGQLTSDQARDRAREALLSYLAASLLLPYDRFLQAAQTQRHDIELLQQQFGASWEQVCHRLTTLRRPGAEGVPFHFLRTDIAGNVSKRFFTSGLTLPRYAGVCPRWIVHEAFVTPDRVVAQLVRTEDGQTHLFVARSVLKPGGAYRAPVSRYSVMLACDSAFSPGIVYADGLAGGPALPVGLTCRHCARADCAQRASPPFTAAVPSDTTR